MERTEFPCCDVFWQGEGVPAEEIDVPVSERRYSGYVGWVDGPAFAFELIEHALHVCGVPVSDDVEYEAQNTELFLLALPVGFATDARASAIHEASNVLSPRERPASRSRSAPPLDDIAPPSNCAWIGRLSTGDRPGRIGVLSDMAGGKLGWRRNECMCKQIHPLVPRPPPRKPAPVNNPG